MSTTRGPVDPWTSTRGPVYPWTRESVPETSSVRTLQRVGKTTGGFPVSLQDPYSSLPSYRVVIFLPSFSSRHLHKNEESLSTYLSHLSLCGSTSRNSEILWIKKSLIYLCGPLPHRHTTHLEGTFLGRKGGSPTNHNIFTSVVPSGPTGTTSWCHPRLLEDLLPVRPDSLLWRDWGTPRDSSRTPSTYGR